MDPIEVNEQALDVSWFDVPVPNVGDVDATSSSFEAKTETGQRHANPDIPRQPPVPVVSETEPVVISDTPKSPPLSLDVLNERSRSALVNILCEASPPLTSTSGSGVIIDPSGIILTNAHIAQYFLLEGSEFPVDCVIRVNSPARPKWHARLIYLPRTWIELHAPDILNSNAKGTGENDFSLLKITGSVDGLPLPDTFPFVDVDPSETVVVTGDPVMVAAYPAEFVGGAAARNSLYASTVFTSITQLLTFTENLVDVVSVSGTALAQSGSSGGAFVNVRGLLVGLIVTTTIADTTGDRNLHAITSAHIDRSLQIHEGKTLKEYLQTSESNGGSAFNQDLKKLSNVLTNAIRDLRD